MALSFFKTLRGIQSLQFQPVRDYAFKSDLKIKWVRPEKISCIKPEKSGDVGGLPEINPTEFLKGYKDSNELKTASPVVQSLFHLRNNSNVHTSNYYRELFIKEVQRHPLDYGSMEAKLARMTATIRRLQEYMEKFPRDKKKKVLLKERIEKRKKFLKYLRRWDYRRFEWILEKLDLVYKPPPAEFHWITRKESLKKLTDKYCENIKEERLTELRNRFKEDQIPFLEKSIKQLQFLQQEQIDLEIPVTITDEYINTMKKELETLKAQKADEETQSKAKSSEE